MAFYNKKTEKAKKQGKTSRKRQNGLKTPSLTLYLFSLSLEKPENSHLTSKRPKTDLKKAEKAKKQGKSAYLTSKGPKNA